MNKLWSKIKLVGELLTDLLFVDFQRFHRVTDDFQFLFQIVNFTTDTCRKTELTGAHCIRLRQFIH